MKSNYQILTVFHEFAYKYIWALIIYAIVIYVYSDEL